MMFVEIRSVASGSPQNISAAADPFDVKITICDTVYTIMERDGDLHIHVDGGLSVMPIGSNLVKLRVVNESNQVRELYESLGMAIEAIGNSDAQFCHEAIERGRAAIARIHG